MTGQHRALTMASQRFDMDRHPYCRFHLCVDCYCRDAR